jgi:hypothetical protein
MTLSFTSAALREEPLIFNADCRFIETPFSVVNGSKNIFLGQRGIIFGNFNVVLGDKCCVVGENNIVRGNDNLVIGSENNVVGPGSVVFRAHKYNHAANNTVSTKLSVSPTSQRVIATTVAGPYGSVTRTIVANDIDHATISLNFPRIYKN